MSTTTKLALSILFAALLFGITGDVLGTVIEVSFATALTASALLLTATR